MEIVPLWCHDWHWSLSKDSGNTLSQMFALPSPFPRRLSNMWKRQTPCHPTPPPPHTHPSLHPVLASCEMMPFSVKLQRLCDKPPCQPAPRECRSNRNDLVMGPAKQWDTLWASWRWEVVPWAVAGLEGRTDSRPCLCRLRRCCCCTWRSCCWIAICWAVSCHRERERDGERGEECLCVKSRHQRFESYDGLV